MGSCCEGLERREQPRLQAESEPDVRPPSGRLFHNTVPLTRYISLLPFPRPQDAIYTDVADVLISVNPYKNIPLLYEVPLQQMQDDPKDEFEESDGEREVSVGNHTGRRNQQKQQTNEHERSSLRRTLSEA